MRKYLVATLGASLVGIVAGMVAGYSIARLAAPYLDYEDDLMNEEDDEEETEQPACWPTTWEGGEVG